MSAQFEQAYKDVGSLKTQPGNDEMLDVSTPSSTPPPTGLLSTSFAARKFPIPRPREPSVNTKGKGKANGGAHVALRVR